MSVKRTPPSTQMSQDPDRRSMVEFSTPMDQDDDIEEELLTPKVSMKRQNLKRVGEKIERSTDDLYDCIINLGTRLSQEFKSECSSIKQELTSKLDEKLGMLNNNIEEIDAKVSKLEESVNRHDKKLDQQGKIVNRLLQEKLRNKMEINGATISQVNDRNKTKEEVIKIFGKCKIRVETASINKVYVKSVKPDDSTNEAQKKPIITVEFNDFETKIRVMKEKRKSNIRNGIYFNDSLTPTNRFLIGKARKIAKEKNFLMYMSNNRINVKKSDTRIKWIEDEADLNEIQGWTPNVRRESKNDNSQSSSQPSGSKSDTQA